MAEGSSVRGPGVGDGEVSKPAAAPELLGGSGSVGGGGGALRERDFVREVFDRLVAEGYVTAAPSSGHQTSRRFLADHDADARLRLLRARIKKIENMLIHQMVSTQENDTSPPSYAHDTRLEEQNVDATTNFDLLEERNGTDDALSTRSNTLYRQIREVLSCIFDKPSCLRQNGHTSIIHGRSEEKKVNAGLAQDCLGKKIVESEPSNGNIQVAEKNLMEKLNKVLIDCVFFSLPEVLIFYPRYEVKPKVDSQTKSVQRLSLFAMIQDADNFNSEKIVVIAFFVVFASVWFLGLLLTQFGHGKGCTSLAAAFTFCTAIFTVAFIDYSLWKCLPNDLLYMVLFGIHCLAMCVGIGYVWRTYVGVGLGLPTLPTFQLASIWKIFHNMRVWHRAREPKNQLSDHLLPSVEPKNHLPNSVSSPAPEIV